jgi:DNA modification methylase
MGIEPGQLWELGRHQLWCGDSTSIDRPQWDVDLVLTDPPFEMSANTVKRAIEVLGDRYIVAGCGNQYRELCQLLNFNFEVISQRSKPQSSPGSDKPQILHWHNAFLTKGEIKHCFDRELVGGYFPSVMPAYNPGISGHYSKPLEWAIDLLKACHADTIADPFSGTGTVLISCERLGKTFVGSEIDPKLCQMIVDRWENATKQKARLTSD